MEERGRVRESCLMARNELMNHVGVTGDEARSLAETALTDIHWLEQTEADVPADNRWLSPTETFCLGGMRFAKRRADWRLGRWTAKRAVTALLNFSTDLPDLANIEIRASSSGAPEVFLLGQPAPVTISLSHRNGIGLCAVGTMQTHFGCDLETVEPRSAAFVADYFTLAEKTLIGQAPAAERPQLAALLWSAKESALKALRVGLRFDTTAVCVSMADPEPLPASAEWHAALPLRLTNSDGWRPLRVRYSGMQVFAGWWRLQDILLRTIVSMLPLRSPVRLRLEDPMVATEPSPF